MIDDPARAAVSDSASLAGDAGPRERPDPGEYQGLDRPPGRRPSPQAQAVLDSVFGSRDGQ